MARVTGFSVPSYTASSSRDSWIRMEGEVLAMVDATLREVRADQDRVYLTGMSFGGAGTWHLSMAHPNRWAAVAQSAVPEIPAAWIGSRTPRCQCGYFRGARHSGASGARLGNRDGSGSGRPSRRSIHRSRGLGPKRLDPRVRGLGPLRMVPFSQAAVRT